MEQGSKDLKNELIFAIMELTQNQRLILLERLKEAGLLEMKVSGNVSK